MGKKHQTVYLKTIKNLSIMPNTILFHDKSASKLAHLHQIEKFRNKQGYYKKQKEKKIINSKLKE